METVEAFSLREFCRRYGISRAHFYNLEKKGLAPGTYRLGRKRMVSRRTAEEWQRAREEAG